MSLKAYRDEAGRLYHLGPNNNRIYDSNGHDAPVAPRQTSWSAPELRAIEFPEPRWAVPGIVAEGVSLLAGPPKVGKSWILLGLGVAIASGGKALGKVDVEEGDVLYLALEDTGRRLQSRLNLVLGTDPAPERLRLATACEPMVLGGEERITTWLDKHPEARGVFVDVFAKVRGHVSDRMNRYDADYAAMSVFSSIAGRYGVPIVVSHHTRKADSADFLDTVSGTHGIAGAADSVMVLARSRGAAAATLKVTGRDVEESAYALEFQPDIGSWQLLDGPAELYELSDTRRAIVTLLRDSGRMTPKEIAEALDLNANTARQTCVRMAKDTQLETDGDGYYRCPLSPPSLLSLVSDSSYRSDST